MTFAHPRITIEADKRDGKPCIRGMRITVNDILGWLSHGMSEEEILDYVCQLRPLAEKIAAKNPDDRPSFFEYLTAMAFLQFARERCDIGVLEVGLGGRLDATNIVTSEVEGLFVPFGSLVGWPNGSMSRRWAARRIRSTPTS